MGLTALAASSVETTSLTWNWQKFMSAIIFIFAGTATTQLYWSLIIPLLRDQRDLPLRREGNRKKYQLFGQLITFYAKANMRFFSARSKVTDMRLLGYLNGLVAFLIFFLVQLFHIAQFSVRQLIR